MLFSVLPSVRPLQKSKSPPGEEGLASQDSSLTGDGVDSSARKNYQNPTSNRRWCQVSPGEFQSSARWFRDDRSILEDGPTRRPPCSLARFALAGADHREVTAAGQEVACNGRLINGVLCQDDRTIHVRSTCQPPPPYAEEICLSHATSVQTRVERRFKAA